MKKKKKPVNLKPAPQSPGEKAVAGADSDSKSRDSEVEKMDFGGIPSRDLKKNLGCG